jgi:hypothetical protein
MLERLWKVRVDAALRSLDILVELWASQKSA